MRGCGGGRSILAEAPPSPRCDAGGKRRRQKERNRQQGRGRAVPLVGLVGSRCGSPTTKIKVAAVDDSRNLRRNVSISDSSSFPKRQTNTDLAASIRVIFHSMYYSLAGMGVAVAETETFSGI